MDTLDAIVLASYEVLDRLLECLNLKSLFTLAMINRSLNNVIIASRKYQFFKLMLRGSGTLTIDKVIETEKKDQCIISVLSTKIDRAFLNYTHYYNNIYAPVLTYNIIRPKNKVRTQLDTALRKLNDEYTRKNENPKVQLCILFDAGLTFVADVDLQGVIYDGSHAFSRVKITVSKTDYNRHAFNRVESWTEDWFRTFFPSEDCYFEERTLLFKPFVNFSKLEERYNSNEYYKCYDCNRFTTK